jgi:hypothetical protein
MSLTPSVCVGVADEKCAVVLDACLRENVNRLSSRAISRYAYQGMFRCDLLAEESRLLECNGCDCGIIC